MFQLNLNHCEVHARDQVDCPEWEYHPWTPKDLMTLGFRPVNVINPNELAQYANVGWLHRERFEFRVFYYSPGLPYAGTWLTLRPKHGLVFPDQDWFYLDPELHG